MKKNIEMIHVNIQVLDYILTQLKKCSLDNESKDDLIHGLSDLLNDDCSALTIETSHGHDFPVSSHKMCFGELEIDKKARRVTRQNQEIYLTPKEFDILYFLACNRGEIFTKQQIYQAVWEDDYLLDDSNIMAFIRKIRKKIEPNPDAPIYILTIWGIGYKFSDQWNETSL